MNRIYRLVWSESRHAWVPASELTTQRRRLSRQSGVVGSARALVIGGIALCALAWHPASHAESSDDAKLNDLQGLVSKYEAPAAQAVPLNVSVAGIAVLPAATRASTAVTGATAATTSHHRAMIAGVRLRAAVPVVPSSEQIASGLGASNVANGLGSARADVAALGDGIAHAVLPATNDVVDRNRAVVLAARASVTSSLVDHNAPAALGADGLVHVGTPAIPAGTSGAVISPLGATVGAHAAVLPGNGDLADVHAHVGITVPALSSTPLVNANVNLHVGGELTKTLDPVLQPIVSGAGGQITGIVSHLPATVDGVTGTVNGVVGGVTAGTPIGGATAIVLAPVDSTLHNVASAVSGIATGNGLSGVIGPDALVTTLPATVSGVTHTVSGVVTAATAGTPVGGVVSSVLPPVTSTVNGVVGTLAGATSGGGLGNVGGLASNLPGTVAGVTNTVSGVVTGATAGTPVGSVVSSVLPPVTSTVNGVVGALAGATSGGGLGNVGGLASNLPGTVAGVTNTVSGVVTSATAGTPVGSVVSSVLPPVTSTVNGVVGTLAGATSGSGAGLGNLGGVVSGVTSTVGSVLGGATPGSGSGANNLGGLVSGVTSTVGSVLGGATSGGGLASSLPATVAGVTSTVSGVVTGATAGTPVGGLVSSVLPAVTGTVNGVVGTVGGTTSGSGLGGVLGSGSSASLGKVLPDVGKTVGAVTSTVGAVVSQPNGTGLTNVLGTDGTASSLLGNLTNTVADTVNSVPGVQVGQTGNGQSSGSNLLGAIPGASNLVDKALPGLASVLGVSSATTSASGTGSSPAGVPVVPGPSATPTGMIITNGGVVGTASSLLGTTASALFNNTNGFVTSGGTQVNAANFAQGYETVSVAGIPVVNLTPVGTALTTVGGAVLGGTGDNSHLTLIGSVKSDSYITNINNGAAGGLLGLLLPNGSPAWASTCANVAGVVQASCWGVNAAQDYQVLMGDGATANGSKEVVIGTNASHTLPAETAAQAFPGSGTNDPNNPTGVPTDDYAARLGHSVVIGDSASGTANAQTIIGANASASVANSVALGYASTATRGAQTGYAAYGLAALQNSAGEVSIGSPGQERQITNVAAGSAATDAVNLAQLQAVSFVAGNAVQYDDATHSTVTMDNTTSTDGGATGGTVLANLHQGDISSSSTQAINGAQMWHWTQDTTNVYSNYSLYNDIQNLSGGSTTINNNNAKYLTVNSTLATATATGTNSTAVGPVASASGNNAVAVGNGASATADNAVALGSGSVADRANTVSVGSVGNERQITNVAAGTQGTDAVNLAQMQSSISTSTAGTVRYDTNTDGSVNYSSVTLGNGNDGTTIHNVANGVATSDAANIGQLNAGIQQAQNWAQNYTDQRFNQLSGQIQNVSNRANAGVAAGMAMAGLPQAYEPGRSMAAVSAGSFRGESSIAIGVSTISQGGRWVYKLTGSADTRGDAGFSIGAGMQW